MGSWSSADVQTFRVQVSEMLCEDENQNWIQRLADTVNDCLRAGAVEHQAYVNMVRDGMFVPGKNGLPVASKSMYAAMTEALGILPDATVDSVMRVVIQGMGGLRMALGVAPLPLQRMLLNHHNKGTSSSASTSQTISGLSEGR